MTSALEPRLKPLDEKVLAALPHDGPGVRRRDIVQAIGPRIMWPSSRERADRRQLEQDVRLILRGLEHLGKAEGRGGWWRAL